MVEEVLQVENVGSKNVPREKLAQIVKEYVSLGEVSIGEGKKVQITVATVDDTDGVPIRVLRMVEGNDREDLSKLSGVGKQIEITDEEKRSFRKCMSRKMPLMTAAFLAFNESEESVDRYLDIFPGYPDSDDADDNAVALGIIGPSSKGKTTLLSETAQWIGDNVLFDRMDVFSKTTIADYLEIGTRGMDNGSTVAEVARSESEETVYKKFRKSSKISMKIKLLSLAGNIAFSRDNFHSTVFFDNPSTFNFSDKRDVPDVFDLVVLEGLDGVLPIEEARDVLSSEVKTKQWIGAVREKSDKIRNYLVENL